MKTHPLKGRKRSPELSQKIAEIKRLRAAERRAARPDCLCYCGCGRPLPKRVSKHTLYLRGHQPHSGCQTPEHRAKLSAMAKARIANGWQVPEESRIRGARKAQETRAARAAAGRVYAHHGSKGKLKGYKWSEEHIEKRAAPMRGRPQKHPLTAKGPQHQGASAGVLRSPDNVTYHYKNLTHFVREHPHLFLPEDVQWSDGKRQTCRAVKGLLGLREKTRPHGTWKGWTVVSFTETFYNRGESLLSGECASDKSKIPAHSS